MFQFLAITTMSHVLKSIKRAMIKWCCQVPKRFSKRKLQVVNTKTNRPIHPQPTSSKTYNPYAVLVPFTSVFLLELTVNTCRKKERPPTTLVAILNLRARSRGHASTNQTFFASEGRTKETNVAHAHNSIWNALNFIRNAGKEEMAAVVLTALISLNVYPVFWGKGRRKNV